MARYPLVLRYSLFVWATTIVALLLPVTARAQKFDITPVAEKTVSQLPPGPLFWRVDTFPTLAKAQAAASQTALAAEVDGRAWLFTLGPPGGSSPGGSKVAEIGPVPSIAASEYLLRVVRSGGPPGAKTPVHTHPGSESFYVLSGELTQKTPEGVNRVSAGQSMPGHPPNTPMQVSSSGTGELSALVMFVNDATKPFSSPAVFPMPETARAAELKVMADSPLGPALSKVADLYRQETGTQVELVLAPSPVVKQKIEAGEAADVVLVQPDFAEELAKLGKVSAEDRPMIGRVGIGLGARSDSPNRDISTSEKLKQTLLGVDTLSFNKVKSGDYFATVLERLGIAEVLKPKIVRTSPLAIFEPVLKGHGNDIAAGTIPLIDTTPGIKYLGPLPGDLQDYLTYTAAPLTSTRQRDAAENFIRFLTSSKAKDSLAANGVN
jgi:molybdate transport system substrate-binding protein